MTEIKKLTDEDLALMPAIAALEAQCFSDPWSERALGESLMTPSYTFFAALENGTLVGYVGAYTVLDEMQITNVAVSPNARRQGIGRKLIDALTEEAKINSLASVTLEVRASNLPARALYEKHGFTVVGTRKNFYTHPTEDGILMTLYLP